jgi:hypothetical protein
MLDPNLKKHMLGAYAQIGKYGYDTVFNMIKGKDFTPKQRELLERRIKIWLILKVLFRHVNLETTPPTLYRITEEEVNRFVRCLVQLAELHDYPVVPSILPTSKPIVIAQLQGAQGEQGIAGTDANIIVENGDANNEVVVTLDVISGVKHYKVALDLYVEPEIVVAFDQTLFEVGVNATPEVTLTSTKGRDSIVSIICDDGPTDAVLQPLINLTTLNDENNQPVALVFNTPIVTANKTYGFSTDDNSVLASKRVTFVYPFLYGMNNTVLASYYLNLTKLVEVQGNKEFVFNGEDKYIYIMYPDTYPELKAIRDNNGHNVINQFTLSAETVNSANLDNNWSNVDYKLYRSTLKTTIDNETFTIEF